MLYTFDNRLSNRPHYSFYWLINEPNRFSGYLFQKILLNGGDIFPFTGLDYHLL